MRPLAASLCLALAGEPALAGEDPGFGPRTTDDLPAEVKAERARGSGDGAYGRFDGDLDLGLGAGTLLDLGTGAFGLGARASAHWFFVAGLYVAYGDGLGADTDPQRRLGVGVDLRPLFLPRWSQDWERGPALLDLALDSLSLGLGASFDDPRGGSFGSRRAFEASLGFGLPLAAWASGPWLEARGALAWPNAGERAATLLAVLSWHFTVETPILRGD